MPTESVGDNLFLNCIAVVVVPFKLEANTSIDFVYTVTFLTSFSAPAFHYGVMCTYVTDYKS